MRPFAHRRRLDEQLEVLGQHFAIRVEPEALHEHLERTGLIPLLKGDDAQVVERIHLPRVLAEHLQENGARFLELPVLNKRLAANEQGALIGG